MPKTLDFRTYLTLERALIHRLTKDWWQRSGSVYSEIAKLCKAQEWDKARQLVPELDLCEVGTENREWIKFMMLSTAVYGAGLVAKEKPSFVGTGSFDNLMNQVASNILQYLEHDATKQVQAEALQLIAEDEAKSKVQKQEHQYGIVMAEVKMGSAVQILNDARALISDDDLAGAGKDVEGNHVTVRYGLLTDDVDPLRDFLVRQFPFEVTVDRLEMFPPSEHSDGAVPIVALLFPSELNNLHYEVEAHASFKPDSFPEYKPHVTLAYVKSEAASKYAGLNVAGSFMVTGLTIGHQSGVKETIPFGMTRKADKNGRFLTPFVSFDQQGDDKLELISSLNASRLATWGFTAECEVRGIQEYELNAVMDGRTSKFCRMINKRRFRVEDARKKIVEALEVQNPDDLRNVQPWPKQTKATLAEFEKLSNDELRDRGFHVPPFHPKCRTVCALVSSEEAEIPTPETGVHQQKITLETLKELGIKATQAEIDHWNAYLGLSPVQMLSKLFGKTPEEVLSGSLGKNAIQFAADGDILLTGKGVADGVKYQVGTVLDPYSGTFYLSEAELVAGDVKAEADFLRKLFTAMIETGQTMTAKTIVVNVTGNVVEYVKLGFLPDPAQWQEIRATALDSLESGDLRPVFDSLNDDQKVLIQHLLQDMDEHAVVALVDVQIDYEGKSIGEWILENVTGEFSLDLSDSLAVAQAKEYLK